MAISTTTLAKVKKGIDAIIVADAPNHPMQVDVIFGNAPTSRQKYITRDTIALFGYPELVPEGDQVVYDTPRPMYSTNWTPLNYVLGWQETKQAEYNDIYSIHGKYAVDARNSILDLERKHGALILGNGFSGTSGPDAGSLFSTAVGAGSGNPTYASEFTTALALSDTALKAARYNMKRIKNPRNRPMIFDDNLYLVVPPELEWTADTLLTSVQVAGTANNDKNVVAAGMSKLCLIDLASTTNWMLIAKDKAKHGLFQAVGMPIYSMMQPDIDTQSTKFTVAKQWVYGWDHSYAIWGSEA